MRGNDVVGTAGGLSPFGHLCWVYRDRAEFRVRAPECMADGLGAGQWIRYVGSGSAGELCAELVGLPAVEEAPGRRRAGVCSVDDFYEFEGGSDVVAPQAAMRASARWPTPLRRCARGSSGRRSPMSDTSSTGR